MAHYLRRAWPIRGTPLECSGSCCAGSGAKIHRCSCDRGRCLRCSAGDCGSSLLQSTPLPEQHAAQRPPGTVFPAGAAGVALRNTHRVRRSDTRHAAPVSPRHRVRERAGYGRLARAARRAVPHPGSRGDGSHGAGTRSHRARARRRHLLSGRRARRCLALLRGSRTRGRVTWRAVLLRRDRDRPAARGWAYHERYRQFPELGGRCGSDCCWQLQSKARREFGHQSAHTAGERLFDHRAHGRRAARPEDSDPRR